MRHLVIGLGEVGKALKEVIKCDGIDQDSSKPQDPVADQNFDMIHICFPWSDLFADQVQHYQESFRPKYTVIHSTVPVGTSRKLHAVYSPIRGKHPDLVKSIQTFKKFVAGRDAVVVASEFSKAGMTTKILPYEEDAEAGKLFDLMQYGIMILLEKEIYKYCTEHGLDFDVVYNQFNKTYNLGYFRMGVHNVQRPNLEHVPGPIGGHCVVQMMSLLNSPSALKIVEENKTL